MIYIYIYIYTVEIINVGFGRGSFYSCGTICSVRQCISQSEVDLFPVYVMYFTGTSKRVLLTIQNTIIQP